MKIVELVARKNAKEAVLTLISLVKNKSDELKAHIITRQLKVYILRADFLYFLGFYFQ